MTLTEFCIVEKLLDDIKIKAVIALEDAGDPEPRRFFRLRNAEINKLWDEMVVELGHVPTDDEIWKSIKAMKDWLAGVSS